MNKKLEDIQHSELEKIYELINENNEDKACSKYYNLILKLEKSNFEALNQLYYECAMLLFNNNYYEDCIKFLYKAYFREYKKSEIKKFIFDSFIEPNRKEFYDSFKINKNLIKQHTDKSDIIYENLLLEFIPISTDRYYIFDLELDKFDEFIDFSENSLLNCTTNDTKIGDDEFSDILIIDDFNIENAKEYIVGYPNKKIYYYSLNIAKTLSFLKLPNIEKYLSNVTFFGSINNIKNYFRNNLNIYIPHILLDSSKEKNFDIQKKVKSILDEEHKFRLTEKGRNRDNILLTIGIPTWNRGNLALDNIKSLLKIPYDSEIEFVVSDNGSTDYKDEYLEIKNMSDSRINYFKFDENKGPTINFTNVISIANGKYVLLLSDEDRINLDVLEHYMNLLKNDNIALIRAATDVFYSNLSNECFSRGYDALKNIFLNGNYISGIIYNKEIFIKCKLKDFNKQYKDNIAYKHYPHVFWNSFMSLNGEVINDNKILVFQGKSVLDEQISKGIRQNNTYIIENISLKLNNMPIYQTYENRILQHCGFIELINNLNTESKQAKIMLYIQLCNKTHFLPSLVKDVYVKNGYKWSYIYDDILQCCLNGINQLNFELSFKEKELIKYYILKWNKAIR